MQKEKKFIDELFFQDYEIETPQGFKNFGGIGKTVEFQEYIIHFKNNDKTFICADTHILINNNNEAVYAKDLKSGDILLSPNSNNGYLEVQELEISSKHSNMYDLLGVDGGIYNTDDIVSHNSTITVGFALHQLLFKSYYNIVLLAQDHSSAKELLSKLKLALENIPLFLQQGITKLNENSIFFENGSRVFAKASSKNAVRGRAVNCIITDELAHVSEAEEMFASIWPTISSGKTTKFFAISTPMGYNLFHKLWVEAERGSNGFVPITIPWNAVPGRDDEWKKNEIAAFGQDFFDREYNCKFESSGRSLIKSEKIKELMDNYTNPSISDDDNNLLIYEEAKENELYVIIVDTSKGVNKDYSAFIVIKISKTPYQVVAVYRNNKISHLVYPEIIKNAASNYNEAYVLIENNEYGHAVALSLSSELEYQNMIWTGTVNTKQRISYGNDGKSIPGVKTSSFVKNIGCQNLKALVEHNKLIIKDYETISELSSFIKVRDSWQAEQGKHDDLVACLWIFGWLTTQDFFKDLEQNIGEEIRDIYDDDIKGMITTVGFIIKETHENDYLEIETTQYSDEDLEDKNCIWYRAKNLDPSNWHDYNRGF